MIPLLLYLLGKSNEPFRKVHSASQPDSEQVSFDYGARHKPKHQISGFQVSGVRCQEVKSIE